MCRAAQMLPTCGQALCMDVAWRPKGKDAYIDTDCLKNSGDQFILHLPDDMGHVAQHSRCCDTRQKQRDCQG